MLRWRSSATEPWRDLRVPFFFVFFRGPTSKEMRLSEWGVACRSSGHRFFLFRDVLKGSQEEPTILQFPFFSETPWRCFDGTHKETPECFLSV